MKSLAGLMWECSCGYVVLGDETPEECPKCKRLNSFVQLPEEIIEEREKEALEEELKKSSDIEEIPKSSLRIKKSKSSKKTTKRRKI